MNNNKSIIIYLDTTLEIYEGDIVNWQYKQLYKILPENGRLNLIDRFQDIWINIKATLDEKEIYFVVAKHAGFTDSRVVYIWLETNFLFENKTFKVVNLPEGLTFIDLDTSSFTQLNKESSKNSSIYSAKPRIGLK